MLALLPWEGRSCSFVELLNLTALGNSGKARSFAPARCSQSNRESGQDTLKMGQFTFHEGELAVQRRVGVMDQAASLQGMVQPYFKPGQPEFIGSRTEAFVSSVDPATGRVWASAVFGAPGFMRADTRASLRVVGGAVHPSDPLSKNSAAESAPLGFLFIELTTRRRNRMNGLSRPQLAPPGGLHVAVIEAYGNCPKYIQRRVIESVDPAQELGDHSQHLPQPQMQPSVSFSQQKLIAESDFFVIGSLSSNSRDADISHRGGRPGFVRVASPTQLWFPDYAGNNLFMTLGNLAVNPSAGLLFVDWQKRSTLQLSGSARLFFPEDLQGLGLLHAFEGASRAVRFDIEQVLETPSAVPFAYEFVDYSPYSPEVKVPKISTAVKSATKSATKSTTSSATKAATISALKAAQKSEVLVSALGDALEADAQTNGKVPPGQEEGQVQEQGDGAQPAATSHTCIRVLAVRQVARGVKTFTFQGPEALRYLPGQYASFLLPTPPGAGPAPPGQDGSSDAKLSRTWTISSAQLSPAGEMHAQLQAGMGLELTGIDGTFSCFSQPWSPPRASKLLFLSAGVGITPMLSMLRGLRGLPGGRSSSAQGANGEPQEAGKGQARADSGDALAASPPVDLVFFHSARHLEEIPYLEELTDACGPGSRLKLRFVTNLSSKLTTSGGGALALDSSARGGRTLLEGRLTAAMLADCVADVAQRQVYLCGPDGYMEAAHTMLASVGVPPTNIHTESFDF
eukprot:jgi/Mesen1/7821/ME000415S07020